jgi:hypothetical protein
MNRTKQKCLKCNCEISVSNVAKHTTACDGTIKSSYLMKKLNMTKSYDNLTYLDCEFCNKVIENKRSLIQHERFCKLNLNRQFTAFHVDHPNYKKPTASNQYIKAKKLGLPKPELTAEQRKAISDKSIERYKSKSQEAKNQISVTISKTVNQKVKNGIWHTSLAKNMHYNYNGIDLHGSWEYRYAKWLDGKQIKWRRPKESFSYIFENKERRYTPDFYLIDTNEYIEIKGFKSSKDEAKWNQFPKNLKLKILVENDLKDINII